MALDLRKDMQTRKRGRMWECYDNGELVLPVVGWSSFPPSNASICCCPNHSWAGLREANVDFCVEIVKNGTTRTGRKSHSWLFDILVSLRYISVCSTTPGSPMNRRDPRLTALQFNECINNRDLGGLAGLMTDDHTFIDRSGNVKSSKQVMVEIWRQFFGLVPHYRNTFEHVQSKGDTVVILGHAYWSEEQPRDPVIWVARIADDLVAEWRILEDTPENRRQFDLSEF